MKNNTNTTFKKSVISLFAVSALASAFVPWENYIPRAETPEMKAFYQNRDRLQGAIITQSLAEIDSATLARIAEDNLLMDAEIEKQEDLHSHLLTEKIYAPEADEYYDLVNQVTSDDRLIDYSTHSTLPEPSEVQVSSNIESPILFSFDSSEIKPEYYQSLNETAMIMKQDESELNNVWQIVGYSDLSGNEQYNAKLAKKRAQKVAAYLVDKGVEEAQLSVISLGASNPINNERSVANNRVERRVEIHPYRAEITALASQFNERLTLKRQAKIAPLPVTSDIAEQTLTTKVVELEPEKTDQLETQIAERLTTAMEL
ncbi:hypothetical protein CW745_01940 [Psychromonas sp. psych-6C06]|uniref:OmpA family protein n=1 Tax=Psychromonas sp. psych-6C06 TaxID=2058089 RepID=UPI000C348B7D|nr:OmpA family protein [Psychromonas sp. psych-6C06]PKF63631.1 hypothetical protein CW745_01940 [Psychromonas sp. psych-6C06]